MPFYLRKSVRVGPFRFNLSKSGIGVSSGIPGFRIGTGPRGTYVHMGRGGLYYRKSLNSLGAQDLSNEVPQSDQIEIPSDTHGPMQEIASGSVARMVDSNSAALLTEIQEKRQRPVYWPFGMAFTIVLFIVLVLMKVSLWISAPLIVAGFLFSFYLHQNDQIKKSVVLMYDLEDSGLECFEQLHSKFDELANCGAVWNVTARGDVYDSRYHAGAKGLINRIRLYPSPQNPPYVKINLSIPHLRLGQKSLYFLPDRILFYSTEGVGAVEYASVKIEINTSRFIEDGSVPKDAEVVDHTWRYVNKDGSPDRRFNGNRQIPICDYEEMRISSSSGVQEILQISKRGVSERISSAIAKTAAEVSRTQSAITNFNSGIAAFPNNNALDKGTDAKANTDLDTQRIHTAIFHILCCVMVADGRASKPEKQSIVDAMKFNRSGWTVETCNAKIDTFLAAILKHGHAAVVRSSLAQLPKIQTAGYSRILIQSIKLIGLTDGEMGNQEKRLRGKIEEMLSQKDA